MISAILAVLSFGLSVFLVGHFMPSVHIPGYLEAVAVALVYGILKFFFYRLLVFLTFPAVALSFGLFLIVLNALFLWATTFFVPGFAIDGVLNLLIAALLITVLDVIFRWIIPGL